jgi:D-arginine dehydrogenase
MTVNRAMTSNPPTVAIVGAGVLGCLTAGEIIKRWPQASVVIFDRDAVASGATRRSAGLHLPAGGTDRVRRMTSYSQDFYQQLRLADPSVPIYPLRACAVVGPAGAQRFMERYIKEANLTRTSDRPDHAAMSDGTQVWTVEGCQYADVFALVQAIARQLRPLVSFREGLRVTAIEPNEDGVVVHLATGETVRFDHVVLAPGPWIGDPAWRDLVAPLGLRVKKIVALHVDQVPGPTGPLVVFQEWDVDPDGMDGLSAATFADAHDALGQHAPGLVQRCQSGRVFCDAYSDDRQPRVQAVDDAGRVVFAGAANGSGYRLAPAIASEAADLLSIHQK